MSSSTNPSERRHHYPITNSGLLNLRKELLRTEHVIANHKSTPTTTTTTTTTSKHDPFTFVNTGKNKKLNSKFINVSSSSRKRSRSPSTSTNKKIKKKNVQNINKDSDSHDEVDWERIQSSLMYKQRVYDYLTATGDIESVIGSGSSSSNLIAHDGPLVDFVSKRYDNIMKKQMINQGTSVANNYVPSVQYNGDNHHSLSTKPITTTRNPKTGDQYLNNKDISDMESLVEIEDEFGRTRRVPRTDITQYLSIDSHDKNGSSDDDIEFPFPPPPPIHYDANREVRDRGAGYYHLAQGEEERIRQQNDLRAIRHETKLKRQLRASELGLSSSTQLDAVKPSLLHNDPTFDLGLPDP